MDFSAWDAYRLYRLHPVAVHFPVALLFSGLALRLIEWRKGREVWQAEACSWALWLGTASAWAAFGLGLLAEETAPHVPMAWEVLADHEAFAKWTLAVFTGASVFRVLERKTRDAPRWIVWGGVALWLVGVGLLGKTAKLGGEVVYDYGMGVVLEDEHEHD
jgi:uncharacterized membrane protein